MAERHETDNQHRGCGRNLAPSYGWWAAGRQRTMRASERLGTRGLDRHRVPSRARV